MGASIQGHRRHSLLWIIGAGIFPGDRNVGAPALAQAACSSDNLWLSLVMPSWKSRLVAIVAVTSSI